MKRWKKTLFVMVLMVPFCITFSLLAQDKGETEELYSTQPREISSGFLKESSLLARLWQGNPSTTHSDPTHSGGAVRLANGDDSMNQEPEKTAVEEKPQEAAKEPEVRKEEPPPIEKKSEGVEDVEMVKEKPLSVEGKSEPVEEKPRPVEEKEKAAEEKPKPAVEKAAEEKPIVFPEARSAGFFSDIDYRGIGTILESKEGKVFMVEGDIAYVSFKTPEPVLIGNKYTVFRASDPVNHPLTYKQIGRRYNITGAIQIIDRYGRFYTVKIIESLDAVSRGDFIRPYNGK